MGIPAGIEWGGASSEVGTARQQLKLFAKTCGENLFVKTEEKYEMFGIAVEVTPSPSIFLKISLIPCHTTCLFGLCVCVCVFRSASFIHRHVLFYIVGG